MTNPVVLKHRHDSVEAMQFTGDYDNGHALYDWLVASCRTTLHRTNLKVEMGSGINRPTYLTFRTLRQRTSSTLEVGDWLVREGDEFYVIPADSQRLVTAIEKIKLEAGMN
jgi:hypothetical protein